MNVPQDHSGWDDEPDEFEPDTVLDHLYSGGMGSVAAGSESPDAEATDTVDTMIFTVTNPPGTVSVSALPNGRPYHIELAPHVTQMTESQLAEEISVIARLAQQNALAGQRLIVANLMSRTGLDRVAVNGYLERDLGLPSMETALADKADVFATRYEHEQD